MRSVGGLLFLLACNGPDKGGTDPGGTDAGDADADADADSDADTDQDDDGFIPPGDCDDSDPLVHPGAEDELYDGVDSDCAGDSDYDGDLDGEDSDQFGGPDCDDADPDVNTSGTEDCNGVDDDCDGDTDDDADDAESWWDDADGDGHGDPATYTTACEQPPGAVDVGDDCDDADPTVYPAAPDVRCDGLDNDCNAATAEPGTVTRDGLPMPDLAAALSGASGGDVIELCEGGYAVSGLDVDDGVVVRGLAGSALTVLDAGGATPVLTVSTLAPVTLEGLTLTNGLGLVFGPTEAFGGGLYVRDDGTVSATDVVITANRAGTGGGVYAGAGADLSFTASSISTNEADPALALVSSAGGVFLGDGGTLALTSTRIDGNTADTCGGAELGDGVVVTGDGASGFDGNASTSLAVGGLCLGSGGALVDVDVTNNTSANSVGGLEGDAVLLDGVVVSGNTAVLDAAGVSVTGTTDIVGCTIENNVADVDGGGIRTFFPGSYVTVRDSVVQGNEALFFAAVGGGALVSQGATLESIDTDWGTGVTDNLPYDVGLVLAAQTYGYAGVASFVCTDDVAGSCQ